MPFVVVTGNIIDQPVDVIVNPWNRNFVPPWLHRSHGTSKAIKSAAGSEPFTEIRKHGLLPLGAAVLTTAGTLPYKGIIHVAGINALWRATPESIRLSVLNAIDMAKVEGFSSLALPVIGSGSGGFDEADAAALIEDVATPVSAGLDVRLVRFTG